jgi:beta-galactosidase GanA
MLAGQGQNKPVSTAPASDIPHLRKQGTATQLIVDGKPFLVLGSQLSVNSASNLDYWKKVVLPRILAQAKLNTVVAAASWAKIEPEEGKFDFSVLDGVIGDLRTHNLRLVLLWFGSWKNGLSSFAPDWVKRDFERFPRAQMVGGPSPLISAGPRRPRAQIAGSRSIELLSPLGDANRDADARAFAALMRHIKTVDGREHTVIMIQLENEVGMQGDTRDRSPLANKAFEGPIPNELMDYLAKHKDTLSPELRQVWEAAGAKSSGTWEEVFGKGRPTDEIFMAWHFAR